MNDGLAAALAEKQRRASLSAALAEKARRSPPEPPEGMFLNPVTGQMTNREMLRENSEPSRVKALGVGALQGYTFNTADEMAGAVGRVEGGAEMQRFRTEQARAMEEANREAYPKTALAGDLVGASLNPINRLMGPTKTAAGAATQGAISGSAYMAGGAEGDAKERSDDAAIGAVGGAIFGAGAKKAVDYGSSAFRKLFTRSAEKPTVESLRAAKTAAYNAVDSSGARFKQAELRASLSKVAKDIKAGGNYYADTDRQTAAALAMVENAAKKRDGLTIGQLDKLRQNLWGRYNAAKNEVAILDIIDAIDDTIASKSAADDLMNAARLANSRYKKAELLDLAFQKAADQTASTGSGGNILNKYRQAVTSIINNPKQAKWFSSEEIDAMRGFVHGTVSENVLRRIGKLSPSGNGLMMALNLGAAAYNPGMLAATAAGAAAKEAADRGVERSRDALVSRVSGYRPPAPPEVPTGTIAAGSAALSELLGQR